MTKVTLLLDLDSLPENVAVGHILEMKGLIPHGEDLENTLSDTYLKMAESWAHGYEMGLKHNV